MKIFIWQNENVPFFLVIKYAYTGCNSKQNGKQCYFIINNGERKTIDKGTDATMPQYEKWKKINNPTTMLLHLYIYQTRQTRRLSKTHTHKSYKKFKPILKQIIIKTTTTATTILCIINSARKKINILYCCHGYKRELNACAWQSHHPIRITIQTIR